MKKTFRALGLLNGVGPIPSALAGVAALAAVADGRAWGGAWGGEGAENRSVRASVVAYVEGKEVPVPDIRMGDAGTVSRILDEGVNRNQVMDHLKHLTKSIGPRLTGLQHPKARRLRRATGHEHAKQDQEWCAHAPRIPQRL